MSMWLGLAKVNPELFAEIQANPHLLDAIFFDEGDRPAGLDERSDVFGCDYRTLSAVAEACAEVDEAGTDWREYYAWLARATGENESDHLPGYEFTYGPAFAFTSADVQRMADGLAEESWSLDEDDARELSGTGEEEEEEEDGVEPEFDDFIDLVPFFAAAAREGKAIVGGIS
jgi:hypothetical protein